VEQFVERMWCEVQQDPAERLLSRATREGHAFIPTLLNPMLGVTDGLPGVGEPQLPEPFLSDDKLASLGIDVETMDRFRKCYLAFRRGDSCGAAGELTEVSSSESLRPARPLGY